MINNKKISSCLKAAGAMVCSFAMIAGMLPYSGITGFAKEDDTVYYTYENEGTHAQKSETTDSEGKKTEVKYNSNNILNNGNGDRKKATPIKVNTEITGMLSTHYETNGNQINEIRGESDVDYYYFKITEPGTVSLTVSHDGVYQGTYKPECGPWFASLYGGTNGATLYTVVDIPGGLQQSEDAIDGHLKSETSFRYNVTEGEYYIEFKNGDYHSLAEPEYFFKVNYEPSKGKKMEQESNETAVTATTIPINEEYWGQLSLQTDIDWYKFTIDKPGAVSIKVAHEGVEYDEVNGSNYYPWYVSLYGDDESSIVYFTNNKVPAGDAYDPKLEDLVNYNLTAGTYYIKINRANYHVGNSYYLTVNYESNSDYEKRVGKKVEQEDNNSVSNANRIDVGVPLDGQLSTNKDEDWYYFTLDKPSYVSFNFKHKEWDDTSKIWTLTLYDNKLLASKLLDDSFAANNPDITTDKEILLPEFNVKGSTAEKNDVVLSFHSNPDGYKYDTGAYPPGVYYFQIKGSKWVPDTYTITVNAKTKDKLDFSWIDFESKSYWYEGAVRQGTYSDPQGVLGDGTVRGREICDVSLTDDAGQVGVWFWLDSVYDGAKAIGKEVWMPYIYQGEAGWTDEEKARIAAESDYGMEGMGRCVLDAINNKSGKWVRYDNDGKMLKGWVTIEKELAKVYPTQVGNTYYYDSRTGLMAKGDVVIDGKQYHFDEITGVLDK